MAELVTPTHAGRGGEPGISGFRLQEALLETVQRLLRDELVVRLYGNDVTSAEGTTLASFVELAGRGYRPVSLAPSLWSLSRLEGRCSVKYQKPLVFGFSGSGALKIYGCYVTRPRDGALLWAERFLPAGAEPIDFYVIHTPGDEIEFTPTIALPSFLGVAA